ncbi:hypothetical protein F4805DRAFT_477998 [Annulohypoxylon moriforme]|nr:hypothetical protein F4805DRAFT_477998 [Annulohypoxylon moriforme]
MAEGHSSYDKVDRPKDRFGDWEARGEDPKRSEDSKPQSDSEENDHRRPPIRTNGRSAKPDGYRDLSTKTPGSVSQLRLSTNDISSRAGNEPQNGGEDECKPQATESQGNLSSSTSGSATSSSIDDPSRVSSPTSPTSPSDVSKPTVRFSDRGPPRASAKRPPVSRRSSANAMPMAEWGVLFDERGYATLRCSQFLKALAKHVIDDLAPGSSSLVITPEKLSTLYSKYRIDQEVYLFVDIFNARTRDAHERIADFFTDLDCQYHLVQLDSYSRPRVPALTPVGFAQYLTTCILAYPDEEFRRLGKIVADVQLVTDSDGQLERLPRQLLRSQFPVRHDPKSRKILEAALDDLMYDLRLHGPDNPKTPAPLAIMPPPPPPPVPSERRGSSSTVGVGVRHYAPPENFPLSSKEAYTRLSGSDKVRSRYMPTGTLQTIGDETATPTPTLTPTPNRTAAAEAFDSMNKYRENFRRNSYHERPLSRYAEDLEVSGYEHAPRQPPQRQNSLDLRPATRFSSPRNSQAGTLTITPTTTTRTYRTTAYTPTSTGNNTPTYRRAQSPPLRTYRASAPDVSISGSSSSNNFKPAGYLPPSTDRRASTSTTADRREYVASLISAGDSCPRNEGSWELERRRGSVVNASSASVAGSKAPNPGSTTAALGPLSSENQHRRTATAPPSPAPGSGEKKHHSHRRRRSAVVTVDDDRGPTWEEVLKAQPLVSHHHRSGSSSKGGGGHHHRHHSGY